MNFPKGSHARSADMPRWLSRFWKQPNKQYRNFQLVYTAITLNFAVPTISYYLDKASTDRRANNLALRLAGRPLPSSEESDVWWILGAGNVATLAFMCALLQHNVLRNRRVLVPLVFLKMASALGYFGVWRRTGHRFFAAASLLDSVTSLAMWLVARSAIQSLDGITDVGDLVPCIALR